MEPILRTEHLTFTYPGEERPTLGDLSLEIARGSFVAVLGHNGSGKSTLAKHFNAILLPTGGKVYVDGMDTSDENNLLSVRATVGMVFQNPDNQIVANVVEDDVAFAPENLGVPPQEIRARVDAALKQVGMYDFRLHAPHLLSGGQKQRVAIAGVIAMQPKCIVLDEPTAMLDPAGRREVIDTATKLCREQGITVVLITHHMEECIGADRVIVLSNGAVVADGAPKQVFSQVDLLKREGLTAPVTVRLLHALRAHGMDVPLDALTVSDCADDLAIPAGQFVGIIGHTGSGKSTFIQHLNGLLAPTSGTVLFDGEDIHRSKAATRDVRFQVGLVFQYPEHQLFEETVYQDIAFGPKNARLSTEEVDARVREAARFAGVDESLFERSPLELSGGQKRRIAIAGVIAMRPQVLILDEPTAGLDPAGCRGVLENIAAYRRETGSAVLLVTHSMDDAARIADRLIVFHAGHVAFDGAPAEVFAHTQELLDIGLDVPQSARIAQALRDRGVALPPSIYTLEQLTDALLAVGKEAGVC